MGRYSFSGETSGLYLGGGQCEPWPTHLLPWLMF